MTRIAGTGGMERIFTGQRKDFICMRKDTFSFTDTYTYTNSAGTEVSYDFTDCVGIMHIKKKKNDSVIVRAAAITFDEYEYTISIDADEMDMDAGKYHYDMQIYDADGAMVTKLYGNFIVLQDVTDFEGTIEKEYTDRFNSDISVEVMPKEKITVLLSSTIANELFAIIKSDYSVIFDSELGIARSQSIVFQTMFGTLVSITRSLNTGDSVIFGSTIEISTFTNYEDTVLFQSSVTAVALSGGGV